MLGRYLPFDSQNDEEIGRKTIYKEINFNHPVWSTVSVEGKDLISKLLIKNRKDRISIKEALDHPWISGQDPVINNLRRKSQDAGNKMMEFIAYSNNNMQNI
jgi:calcium/calmodulin-dependent protein kinase I